MPTSIPYLEFGDGEQTILFAHANGFPAGTYRCLLEPLSKHYRVLAPQLRPMWQTMEDFYKDYANRHFWHRMADDQIAFIEQHELAPVTYIGHSLGSVVGLMAAHKRPDLFARLIMIEPVFLKARYTRLMRYMPKRIKRKVPIVRKALGRPDRWPDMQAAFEFHRGKRVFGGFSDDILWDYINAGVGPIDESDEVGLLFDKHWEALAYSTVPNTWPLLKATQVPINLLRAEHSDTIDDDSWARWHTLPGPKQATQFDDTYHLLPLDHPDMVTEHILAILEADK